MTAPLSFILSLPRRLPAMQDNPGRPFRHERRLPPRVSSAAMVAPANLRPNGASANGAPALRATFAALCANLVGVGLGRFGYTPLIPALISAGWFRPSDAVYLGAANLAGYLAGALGARRLGVLAGPQTTLRCAMLLTAASLFACAFPLG